jgi:N-acetylmuramoyl-L-alanine amidase
MIKDRLPMFIRHNRRTVANMLVGLFLLDHNIAQAQTTAGAPVAKCSPGKFSIVIDVGHTPEAPGATSASGKTEYSFNLSLAKAISAALTAAKFSRTYLMLSAGVGKTQLVERVNRASSFGPDLFIAIHHDSVQEKYLSSWQVGGVTRQYSDVFSGYSIFVNSQSTFSKPSLQFAELLSEALIESGLKFSLHHAEKISGEARTLLDPDKGIYQFDDLIVLRKATYPALLFEAGVIVNRADEPVLASVERQDLVSKALTAAATEFCSMRQSIQ